MLPLTEIFCLIDDFCNFFEKETRRRSLGNPDAKRKRAYTMTLSEIMTILVLFHMSSYRTFKDFYMQGVLLSLRREFPNCVSYHRFVELMKDAVIPLTILINGCSGKATGRYYVDSTKLPVCHNLRISRNKVFKGIARRGKTSTGWFFGFKLHLVLNDRGELMSFTVSPGNRDDRAVVRKLVRNLKGWLFGDRGYISKALKASLGEQGLELITHPRANMKPRCLSALKKFFLSQRRIIETAIGQLKAICQIDHTRHRSPNNFLANLLAGLLAYIFKPRKPSVRWAHSLPSLALTSN